MKDRKKAEIEYYDKRVKNSGRDFKWSFLIIILIWFLMVELFLPWI